MKMFNKSVIGLAIACCFAVLPAAATTITVESFTQSNPTTVHIASVTPPLTEFVYAGAFNTREGTRSFISWCADIFKGITLGETVTDYTLIDNAASLSRIGAIRSNALGILATQHLGQVNSAETAGAFQLAIWEILYESADTGYNLSSGNFKAFGASDGSIGLAQSWLGSLTGANAFKVSIFESPTHQDLAVFTQVPEPATLGLLALGLIGLGFAKRKGRNAA